MDETRCNNVLMGNRRWRNPKAYEKHIGSCEELISGGVAFVLFCCLISYDSILCAFQ